MPSLPQAIWQDPSAPQSQDVEEELSGTSRPHHEDDHKDDHEGDHENDHNYDNEEVGDIYDFYFLPFPIRSVIKFQQPESQKPRKNSQRTDVSLTTLIAGEMFWI